MQSIRSFVAIELSAEAQASLLALQNELRRKVPAHSVRWTAPQNIHLTLHFLGDISPAAIERAGQALAGTTAAHRPFALELARLGTFPNNRRPRIIWVGVDGALKALLALQQRLGQKLHESIDFSRDSRPYAPHLTIGRVSKGLSGDQLGQLGEILAAEQQRVNQLASLPVREIVLMRSELNAAGPIYTRLARSPLPDSPSA
jgi:2'-5' RNA ligase